MIPHEKRFKVALSSWSDKTLKTEENEFDTEKEWKEFVSLINSVYENNVDIKDKYGEVKKHGYIVIDFQEQKIVKWGLEKQVYLKGLSHYITSKTNPLKLKDMIFRGDDEIPKNYNWDDGEYEGWLQFRWGDGKNAIDYKPAKKESSKAKFVQHKDMQDMFDEQNTKEKMLLKKDRW